MSGAQDKALDLTNRKAILVRKLMALSLEFKGATRIEEQLITYGRQLGDKTQFNESLLDKISKEAEKLAQALQVMKMEYQAVITRLTDNQQAEACGNELKGEISVYIDRMHSDLRPSFIDAQQFQASVANRLAKAQAELVQKQEQEAQEEKQAAKEKELAAEEARKVAKQIVDIKRQLKEIRQQLCDKTLAEKIDSLLPADVNLSEAAQSLADATKRHQEYTQCIANFETLNADVEQVEDGALGELVGSYLEKMRGVVSDRPTLTEAKEYLADADAKLKEKIKWDIKAYYEELLLVELKDTAGHRTPSKRLQLCARDTVAEEIDVYVKMHPENELEPTVASLKEIKALYLKASKQVRLYQDLANDLTSLQERVVRDHGQQHPLVSAIGGELARMEVGNVASRLTLEEGRKSFESLKEGKNNADIALAQKQRREAAQAKMLTEQKEQLSTGANELLVEVEKLYDKKQLSSVNTLRQAVKELTSESKKPVVVMQANPAVIHANRTAKTSSNLAATTPEVRIGNALNKLWPTDSAGAGKSIVELTRDISVAKNNFVALNAAIAQFRGLAQSKFTTTNSDGLKSILALITGPKISNKELVDKLADIADSRLNPGRCFGEFFGGKYRFFANKYRESSVIGKGRNPNAGTLYGMFKGLAGKENDFPKLLGELQKINEFIDKHTFEPGKTDETNSNSVTPNSSPGGSTALHRLPPLGPVAAPRLRATSR